MINVPDRRRAVELIEEAVDTGAPALKAREELEISLRTYKRWTDGDGIKADGRPDFDVSKPDGTPCKLMDVSRLASLGWRSRIGLEEGLRDICAWFVVNQDQFRR